MSDNLLAIQDHVYSVLELLGEDPTREGLEDTPKRVAKMWQEMLRGTNEDPSQLFTFFEPESYDQMIVQRGIKLNSTCEHHMMPFIGRAHVGYLPDQKIVGLSKLARVVQLFSARLQVQERLTNQIADCLENNLSPKGVMVIIEAEHQCMALRGAKAEGSATITTALRGAFKENRATREEFLASVGRAM